MSKKFFVQAFKYGIVGLANTFLTAAVIWFMMRFVFGVKGDSEASHAAVSISNFCGYFIGLINSFIFNRTWTFKSKESWNTGFLKFVAAFGVCYIIQLGVVLFLNTYASIPSLKYTWDGVVYTLTSAYICQLIGIVVYTMLNFICNKYYTFRK